MKGVTRAAGSDNGLVDVDAMLVQHIERVELWQNLPIFHQLNLKLTHRSWLVLITTDFIHYCNESKRTSAQGTFLEPGTWPEWSPRRGSGVSPWKRAAGRISTSWKSFFEIFSLIWPKLINKVGSYLAIKRDFGSFFAGSCLDQLGRVFKVLWIKRSVHYCHIFMAK